MLPSFVIDFTTLLLSARTTCWSSPQDGGARTPDPNRSHPIRGTALNAGNRAGRG